MIRKSNTRMKCRRLISRNLSELPLHHSGCAVEHSISEGATSDVLAPSVTLDVKDALSVIVTVVVQNLK